MPSAILQNHEAEIRPPVTSVGVIGWVKQNLFDGWFNTLLTLVTVYFLYRIGPPLFRWMFMDSVWFGPASECNQNPGACWSIISSNFRFILFGFYPYDQQWRPLLAMLILFGFLYYSRDRRRWTKRLGYAWIIGLSAMGILMRG
ncbi:MAG: amino acid ABC transporter permease, partial [Deltaproteobacteria bacterium]|nr:amino acid ABC transporter permease [Deltaproteobacteria bacterium]